MLEIILQQLVDAGFKHFYLSVNYLKNQIKDYFVMASTGVRKLLILKKINLWVQLAR